LVVAVEPAIHASNLGLNPQTEGQVIRLRMPDLTQDRRKELVKVAHQYAEKARIAVRNVRRDGMDQLNALEKDHAMSEDDHKKKADETQKMTDETIKEIDASLKAKEAEIMQV
jgi:ribosome recycling factor